MSDVPSTLQQALPEIDPANRRRSRIKLISIFAIFFIPLILATLYLQMVRLGGGSVGDTSRGELINPAVPISEFKLSALQGPDDDFTLDTLRGLWTMLYIPAGDCEQTCQRNLYHMRQIRLALNHRMDRVQRAVVVQNATQVPESILAEHKGLVAATGEHTQLDRFVAQFDNAQQGMAPLQDAIYLIDPFGNLMLRFPHDLAPGLMLKDIKHLLKVSRIG
jgi:cytochrome oxidase Cu insertion factor (SCO1/SenC/PrrC family)